MFRTLTNLLFLLLFAASPVFGAGVEAPELIHQAGDLARRGEWDRSETAYLKAAQSPFSEHRMQAYEGLTKLYSRLRLNKKAARALKRLDDEKKFAASLVPEDSRFYKRVKLKRGDTYARIAFREKVSLEWLKRANQHQRLIEGKSIRVPIEKFELVVRKKDRIIEWRRGKDLLKSYPIAVGKKETETPAGDFEVITKVKHPVWYHLKLQIPPDSPQNLLGTRWLGLNAKGYGIHGTRHSGTIRSAVSHGCVRMLNRDIEELFEWMDVGVKVSIRED